MNETNICVQIPQKMAPCLPVIQFSVQKHSAFERQTQSLPLHKWQRTAERTAQSLVAGIWFIPVPRIFRISSLTKDSFVRQESNYALEKEGYMTRYTETDN